MTFKDLRKVVNLETAATARATSQQQHQSRLFERLHNKSFWIWNVQEHKQEHARSQACCFNHIIGVPQKNGVPKPFYDYEKIIFDSLMTADSSKHLWIKKATGLGISEFMLRFMASLCLRDNALSGAQMCIVTGPRIDLAIALINRMKKLFVAAAAASAAGNGGNGKAPAGAAAAASANANAIIFDTKETVLELNNVKIEAFPSHHLDAMRGLPSVSFIFLDEADFFPSGQQAGVHVMVSTPNAPDGLFERIEKESEETCLYKRIFLDYTYGIGKIYTAYEVEKAKQSPSFEREYKYGISAFGIVVTEWADGIVQIMHAEEYHRPDYNEMLSLVYGLISEYQIKCILMVLLHHS